MPDTLEGLAAELEQEKRKNSKLLDLLLSVQRGFPEVEGRVADMIFQLQHQKKSLEETQSMIDCKLVFNGCASLQICKERGKCVQRDL